MYFGDYIPGQKVTIPWSTNSKQGASISRSVLGSVIVFRASTGTFSSVGVIDQSDASGIAGVDFCSIDTTNAFYAAHDDYLVVLNGATVDGVAVNAVLGEFSILNRATSRLWVAGTVDISGFAPTAIEFECADITTEAANNNLAGRSIYASLGNALFKQVAVIESSSLSSANKGHFVIPAGAPLTAPFANGARIVIV